jgi:hypothetical protein
MTLKNKNGQNVQFKDFKEEFISEIPESKQLHYYLRFRSIYCNHTELGMMEPTKHGVCPHGVTAMTTQHLLYVPGHGAMAERPEHKAWRSLDTHNCLYI